MNRLIAGVVVLLGSSFAQADFLGVYLGGGVWNSGYSGNIIDGVSLQSELGVNGDSSTQFYIAFEHPVPLLPNIKVARADIRDDGVATITAPVDFEGTLFPAGSTLSTTLDLSHTDVTLYYEIIDIGMDFDVGITARIMDGEATLDTESVEIEGVVPLLYLRAKVGLPFTGTYFGAQANVVSYSGNSLTDLSAVVGWEIENFILPEFGVEVGYRRWSLKLDENDVDLDTDMDLDGIFFNLTAHF